MLGVHVDLGFVSDWPLKPSERRSVFREARSATRGWLSLLDNFSWMDCHCDVPWYRRE
jgi:hypothetical protein